MRQLPQKQLHRGRDTKVDRWEDLSSMSAGDGWGLMQASAFISPSGRWVELEVRGQNTGKMRTIKVSLKEEVWELGRKTPIKEVDPSQHPNAPRAAFKAARTEKAALLETSNVKSEKNILQFDFFTVQQCKAGHHGYREALLRCSALRKLKVVCDWLWGVTWERGRLWQHFRVMSSVFLCCDAKPPFSVITRVTQVRFKNQDPVLWARVSTHATMCWIKTHRETDVLIRKGIYFFFSIHVKSRRDVLIERLISLISMFVSTWTFTILHHKVCFRLRLHKFKKHLRAMIDWH